MKDAEFYYEAGRHHEGEEHQASWRDDKYHDHTGFDLIDHHFESDHHGIKHRDD